MKIKIICVGKIKEKFFTDAINEYLKRLSSYAKVEIIEVKDEMIVFEFDCNSDLDDLFVGDYIKSITFYRNSECIHYSGYVNSINQDTKSVILELVDFNEKKY